MKFRKLYLAPTSYAFIRLATSHRRERRGSATAVTVAIDGHGRMAFFGAYARFGKIRERRQCFAVSAYYERIVAVGKPRRPCRTHRGNYGRRLIRLLRSFVRKPQRISVIAHSKQLVSIRRIRHLIYHVEQRDLRQHFVFFGIDLSQSV